MGFAIVAIARPIDSVIGYPNTMPATTNTVAAAAAKTAALTALAHPKAGNKVGVLSIPALGQKLPIVEGTGSSQLSRGVGHFHGSVMPGGNDNCVLSGHRDTVFTKLGRLKKGNRLVVTTAAGTFTYKITQIRIVRASDKTVVVHTDRAILTVTTCYPFHYVGSAPYRYVLVAGLVSK
jgi:sortase A